MTQNSSRRSSCIARRAAKQGARPAVCPQAAVDTKEHAFGTWRLITCLAWKNNANATVRGVGILLNPLTYKAVASIEMITNRIMVATFHGKPQTTLICCYSPTNVRVESEVDDFYEVLESVTRAVPKHHLLIIGGDFNAHLGQQDGFKFAYHHQSNRNGIKWKIICMQTILYVLTRLFEKDLVKFGPTAPLTEIEPNSTTS